MPRFKRIALPCLLIMAIIGGWLFSQWASSPSVSIVRSRSTAAPTASPKYRPITFSTFSTRIPYSLKTRVTQDPKTSSLVSVVVFGSGSSTVQIGITCNVLPPDGFNGIADYNFRRTNTTEYTALAHPVLDTQGGSVFQKIQGPTEIAYFMSHNDRYTSIVVTGTESADKARKMADDILQNWVWK